MSKLDKSTVALTFKFDCDRFLRYRLATKVEVDSKTVPNAIALRNASRPGINLITAQGRAWEARCYDDIVTASKGKTKFQRGSFDKEIDREKYDAVKELELAKTLAEKTPPSFVIEAEFKIPGSIGEGLKTALDSERLSAAIGRPDLLWIRPFEVDAPLVESSHQNPEFVLHVIDVKLAAEPSLRHFVEVTFYALGLQAWLKEKKLSDRYGVCAAGLVWPGTHEASAFKNLVAKFTADGSVDALADALTETTFAVPYEVYRPRLQQFIDSRLPAVLHTTPPSAATWHVSKKCQLCEFFAHCQKEALKSDAISQLPGLTAGQASVLHKAGISTLTQLHAAIVGNTAPWVTARTESHALRAQQGAILARCEALASGQLVPIPGRRTTAMPKFAHLSILLTAHFDPGTGITFAFGANKVHFKGDGTPPNVEEVYLPVDSIDSPGSIMSPVSEGSRLAELCQKVKGWLEDLDATNKLLPADDKQTVHFYVWDGMEARQLARVVARHAGNEEIMEQAAFLLRVFPPEGELANAADWKSQPLTIVKPIVRNLFALPVPFEYTLMDARNWLEPFIKDGSHIKIQQVWGFATDMSDQIPLERAYEIWQDKPMLRKWHATKPWEEWPRYTKEEIRDGIKTALKTHLKALREVVSAMTRKYGKQLLLQKEPFSLLKPPVQMRLPTESVYVLTMEKLNSVAAELENRETLSLPVEEREAQFISIRGVVPAAASPVVAALEAEVEADPRYSQRLSVGDDIVMVFEFSRDSRDSRLREGAFTVVLRDEDSEFPLETKWYKAAGYSNYPEAAAKGLSRNGNFRQFQSLKTLLGVNIGRIDSISNPPLVALLIEKENFLMAQKAGIREMTKPMVLDPIHRDFSTELIEKAVRKLGGKSK